MANRYTFHIKHLEPFKIWLEDNEIPWRKGKGDWQVLQVYTNNGWQVLYSRLDMPEHYTVQDKLMPIVRKFLKDHKNENV